MKDLMTTWGIPCRILFKKIFEEVANNTKKKKEETFFLISCMYQKMYSIKNFTSKKDSLQIFNRFTSFLQTKEIESKIICKIEKVNICRKQKKGNWNLTMIRRLGKIKKKNKKLNPNNIRLT